MVNELSEGSKPGEAHRPFLARKAGREQRPLETELGRFLQPKIGMSDRPKLA